MRYFQWNQHPIELVISENIEKKFDTHNHTQHYVISMIVCGNVELHTENEKIECIGENIFIIPPYVSHSVCQSKGSCLISLCIGISLIEKYPFHIAKNLIQEFLEELYQQKSIDFNQKEGFLYVLKHIYDLHQKKQAGLETDMGILVNQMIKQPEKELKLEQLAETVFVSKYHLIRKFKNSVGMTPHQFHIQNKVRKAQQLLCQGSSVIETTTEMGFYDQSHFHKNFSKMAGISPSEYLTSRKEVH